MLIEREIVHMKYKIALTVVTFGAAIAALPAAVSAQIADDWKFQAIIYGYLPEIRGSSTFSSQIGGDGITVDAHNIISNLKFAFMGTIEAQKGRWGFLTDVMYMNVGGSKSNTRNLSIGPRNELPVGVTADLNLDIKAAVWELVGSYRLSADPTASVDVLAGARMLDLKQTLDWDFSADLGPLQPARSGNSEIKATNWDAIIGLKGRVAFGPNREWFVPYYIDVGTGDSDLTWQAIAGVGYSFKWGDLIAGWRYLDYNFKSSSKIDDMSLSGPMLGVALRW
jgi:hypothetical protein